MSFWKDEHDFMRDIENISEFYIPGEHNNPAKKFELKTDKPVKIPSTPWYESDESDEEIDYSSGRGKRTSDSGKNPGGDHSHLDVMREIQMQVRSAVGNRYNNEVLESYYNVAREDPPTSPTQAPKEISIAYAKEQRQTIDNPTQAKFLETGQSSSDNSKNSPIQSASSSSSSSPRKGRKKFGEKRYVGSGNGKGDGRGNGWGQNKGRRDNFPFNVNRSKIGDVNVDSKSDFPPLS